MFKKENGLSAVQGAAQASQKQESGSLIPAENRYGIWTVVGWSIGTSLLTGAVSSVFAFFIGKNVQKKRDIPEINGMRAIVNELIQRSKGKKRE